MAFVPKPNTGTLWPNDRKSSMNHPDLRGDLFLDRLFMQDLVDTCEGNTIKISVAAWNKTIANKECLSLSVSLPFVKNETPKAAPADDEDVPF